MRPQHRLAPAATYELRRTSGDDLALTREHDAVAQPRRGEIRWSSFDATTCPEAALDRAAALWRTRAAQEMRSLALFTELASQLHVLGAPLDWSGAFARMIADEVRHTDLCLRTCETLGRPAAPSIDPARLRMLDRSPTPTHVRRAVIATFCVGETISGRMFRSALKAATVPFAREVVAAIVVDETFHGELGWELGALLMRRDGAAFDTERAALAAALPSLFRHYAKACGAAHGPAWAAQGPAAEPEPNFGELTSAGYARDFFEAMEHDVVPGLVAIGLPEAESAFASVVAELDSHTTP